MNQHALFNQIAVALFDARREGCAIANRLYETAADLFAKTNALHAKGRCTQENRLILDSIRLDACLIRDEEHGARGRTLEWKPYASE